MLLIHVSLLSTMNYKEQDLYCVLILFVLLNKYQLEEEGERGQGRKRRKEISYTLQLESTCTFCSHLVWFPIRRHWGFSTTDFSLELAFSLRSRKSHLLHIVSTTHRSSVPHPQAHTAKGETNQKESQRFRVILQVIFPSQGALP